MIDSEEKVPVEGTANQESDNVVQQPCETFEAETVAKPAAQEAVVEAVLDSEEAAPVSEEAAPEVEETVAEAEPQPNSEPVEAETLAEEQPTEEPTSTEAPAEEQPTEEPTSTEAPAEEQPTPKVYASKAEIIERLKEISASDDNPDKSELDRLKAAFYKIHTAQREAEMAAFIEKGGTAETFVVEPDAEEEEFKAQMSIIRDKREAARLRQDAERKANLEKKLAIIERIKAMATSPDEANKCYQEFKSLQQQWREIKAVPAEAATELWRNYQHCVEQFYDLLKLNHEAREYDFRKNLELKTKLCEAAERLADEADVLSAFHQLQELHVQYRETGPVAKEFRESIWARFKAASTVINKRHQQYFDNLRSSEEENLRKKTELCEQADTLAAQECKAMADWDSITQKIIEIQKQWKSIGFAPQKMNEKIFARFRATCDEFFARKAEFFKGVKEVYAKNLELKRALVEKAQALQDSTEWRSTSDKLVALQREWRSIGVVPRKQGNKLWAEFIAACNKFFDARKAATSDTRTQERENLAKKREIIAQIQQINEQQPDDAQEQIQALADQYAEIGHVPFKEKEALYQEFRQAVGDNYRGGGRGRQARQSARKAEGGGDNERSRLLRRYDQLRQEAITYENNLGFLSATSKNASSLVEEIQQKIQRLKDEIEQTRKRIKEIDSQETAEE